MHVFLFYEVAGYQGYLRGILRKAHPVVDSDEAADHLPPDPMVYGVSFCQAFQVELLGRDEVTTLELEGETLQVVQVLNHLVFVEDL